MGRLNDRPDMTFDVYRGRKTTTQQQQQQTLTDSFRGLFALLYVEGSFLYLHALHCRMRKF